ncbi:unnamed protein product [Cochlearia groenlandica]
MTLKIPIQETAKMVGSLRVYGSEIAETMAISNREMFIDEKVYVAVIWKDLESKSSIVWAIQNTGGREFCIVYVHKTVQNSIHFHEQKLRAFRKEKENAHKNLDKYLHICKQMQVNAEKIYIETDSVEKGILELISQRGVKKLVMGAAANRYYSMRMKDVRSKKAIYICREAPVTCHIWFTCNGYLICSREARRGENLYLEYTKETENVPSSSSVKQDDPIHVALIEAEICANDAIKRAKESESVYLNELKRRKETEKALKVAQEELQKMRLESETRIAESNTVITKLQEKYNLSIKALRRLRNEQEELVIELSKVSKLKSMHNKQEDMSLSKDREPPQYFLCPIIKDIMEDPQVAADGFTYEGEAISGWFERGHETSPMTNKTLAHTTLVPNLALKSAIQEWLQASSNS